MSSNFISPLDGKYRERSICTSDHAYIIDVIDTMTLVKMNNCRFFCYHHPLTDFQGTDIRASKE